MALPWTRALLPSCCNSLATSSWPLPDAWYSAVGRTTVLPYRTNLGTTVEQPPPRIYLSDFCHVAALAALKAHAVSNLAFPPSCP